ncbi:MAG: hypothetical protein ACP5UV_02765 [Thermoplasmata archaeon]
MATINSSNEAADVAKNWANSQFGVDRDRVNVVSAGKVTGNNWFVRITFILNNEEKAYSLTIDSTGNILKFTDIKRVVYSGNTMGSAPTMILIAEVFSILALIGFLIAIIASVFGVITSVNVITSSAPGAPVPSPFPAIFLIIVIVYAIFLIIGVYVLSRILKMRSFIHAGDAKSAYELNTVGLGVLALIFNGVITGILLLISREDLRNAFSQNDGWSDLQ